MRSRDVDDVWEEENLPPFDEMIISWNGKRPLSGQMDLFVSVIEDEWIPYASWGAREQSSFNLDIVQVPLSNRFKIRVTKPVTVHVYTNGEKRELQEMDYHFVELAVPPCSQMVVPHPRCRDLCSPTSLRSVLQYLLQKRVDALDLLERVKDQKFDIFGNWVLNVAEASHLLGPSWRVWVERLDGFGGIYERLQRKIPVIVSVKGPLLGGALPYAAGHLLVVRGFDPANQEVLCMDPAFDADEKTYVRYPLDEFLLAWGRRGFIAYMFDTNGNNPLS